MPRARRAPACACCRPARRILVRCVLPSRRSIDTSSMTAGTSTPFTCVCDARASLGECPVWSDDEQVLYWVDINTPALHRFDPATGHDAAMPMPEAIGCFALSATSGFIVALRSGLWRADRNGKLEGKIAAAPYDTVHFRFNDGRCDAQGRFFVGSMNERRDANAAALYRLDPDGALRQVLSVMMISKGVDLNTAGRTLSPAVPP